MEEKTKLGSIIIISILVGVFLGNFFRPTPPATWAAVSVKGLEIVSAETIKMKDKYPQEAQYFNNILRYNYLQACEYKELFRMFGLDTKRIEETIEKLK